MRVTSEIWVSALTRRVFGAGGFATVAKRGASEAGAVFLILRGRAGEMTLLGPAAQSAYDGRKPTDRLFTTLLTTDEPDAVEDRLARERKFDPDLWIVELEIEGIEAEPPLFFTTP